MDGRHNLSVQWLLRTHHGTSDELIEGVARAKRFSRSTRANADARLGKAVRVRRSRHVVLYWHQNQLIARNYATGTAAVVPAFVCHLLDFCAEWKTREEIQAFFPFVKPAALVNALRQLVTRTFLQQSNHAETASERAMRALEPWNPEAGFFHTVTKDVRFWSRRESGRRARMRGNHEPMPPPFKSYPGLPTVTLPPPLGDGEFARVARRRRTWRRFSSTPVTRDELATVLGLSVGVQQWLRLGRSVEAPLKTSPSGGARHPIECYVVARHVKDLTPGIYHYSAGRHALSRLRRGATAAQIRSYLPHSGYFAKASALVLFTAMFERQLWRYPYSRAYRAALIEVGHVCQTFCLAATSLGLAPFSVMALADSLIERDLGIDGITETVLYAAGVGRPPGKTSWAPLARGTLAVRENLCLRPRNS